jgi:hypothetical protein
MKKAPKGNITKHTQLWYKEGGAACVYISVSFVNSRKREASTSGRPPDVKPVPIKINAKTHRRESHSDFNSSIAFKTTKH